MASWADLWNRLEKTIRSNDRLHIEAAYHGGSLPKWLAEPVDACAQNAGDQLPVVVVNQKGRAVDGALVVMALGDFERLAAARGARGARVDRFKPPGGRLIR